MAASDEQPSRIYDDAFKFSAPDVLMLKERVSGHEERLSDVEFALQGGYGLSRLDEIEGRIDALQGKRTEKGGYSYLSWLLPAVAGAVALLWLLWEAYRDDTGAA